MKDLIRPTRTKVLAFVVLAVALLLILSSHTARISFFPCQTQPVVENPPPYRSDWCGLWQLSPGFAGLRVQLTLGGLVVVALVLVVLPYLAACTLGRLLDR